MHKTLFVFNRRPDLMSIPFSLICLLNQKFMMIAVSNIYSAAEVWFLFPFKSHYKDW